MSRVEPTVTEYKCAGCASVFDEVEDVCTIPHVIGTGNVGHLCPRCHITALGVPQPHAFRDQALL